MRCAATMVWLLLASLASMTGVMAQESSKDDIVAGPMVGHATETTAQIWVQVAEAAEVSIAYWPVGKPKARLVSADVKTTLTAPHTATVILSGLPYGTDFHFSVAVDGVPALLDRELRFKTQPHWRWRTDPPVFDVAIGSCAYVNDRISDRPGRPYGDGDARIFRTIAKFHPDLMLWLGDNCYFREPDFSSESAMKARYARGRAVRELQGLLGTTHHYAIWDDHDFGPNDSDWTFSGRAAALRIFKQFWANPGYGLPETKGVFTRFTWGDVDFFLLDDRYWRSPNRVPNNARDKRMWGDAQRRWLVDALTSSRAPFKIVANGNQVLNRASRHESASTLFPRSTDALLRSLRERKVEGVVFLSGDRHHAEILKQPLGNPAGRGAKAGGYHLVEFTSSPLLSGVHTLEEQERDNPLRIPGCILEQMHNFGRLRFSGKRGNRVLTMECIDREGKLRFSHRIHEDDLKWRQRSRQK